MHTLIAHQIQIRRMPVSVVHVKLDLAFHILPCFEVRTRQYRHQMLANDRVNEIESDHVKAICSSRRDDYTFGPQGSLSFDALGESRS